MIKCFLIPAVAMDMISSYHITPTPPFPPLPPPLPPSLYLENSSKVFTYFFQA